MPCRGCHAIETLDSAEREAAILGYRYFGLDQAADVLVEVSTRWAGGHIDDESADQLESDADALYRDAVPDDSILVLAFEGRLESTPDEFASLSEL